MRFEFKRDNKKRPTNHFKTAVYSYDGEIFWFIQMLIKVKLLFIIEKILQMIKKMK